MTVDSGRVQFTVGLKTCYFALIFVYKLIHVYQIFKFFNLKTFSTSF